MAIDGISRYAWGVPTKTYGQMCPLARSLDVLGERWTMLVIRELLLGPSSSSTSSRSSRRSGATGSRSDCEDSRRQASSTRPRSLPAGVAVYELTEEGERLRDPLIALGL